MPNYGYAYNNGKNIIVFYGACEDVTDIKACKWARNTNNYVQPLGEEKDVIRCCYCGGILTSEYVKATDGIIDAPKYACKKCMAGKR